MTPVESTNQSRQVSGTSDHGEGVVNCFYRTCPVSAAFIRSWPEFGTGFKSSEAGAKGIEVLSPLPRARAACICSGRELISPR
jgi:hypothetical protein